MVIRASCHLFQTISSIKILIESINHRGIFRIIVNRRKWTTRIVSDTVMELSKFNRGAHLLWRRYDRTGIICFVKDLRWITIGANLQQMLALNFLVNEVFYNPLLLFSSSSFQTIKLYGEVRKGRMIRIINKKMRKAELDTRQSNSFDEFYKILFMRWALAILSSWLRRIMGMRHQNDIE